MPKFFLFGLIFLSVSLGLAEDFQQLNLSKNRILTYQASIQNPEEPVLIFLPGIYRGFFENERFLKILKNQKVNFVHFHFAEQPDSVVVTENGRPDFSEVTADDLADEVTLLVKTLKISRPVPVTLSFSAVVTSHLDPQVFPVVIETSPIGKDTDGLPESVVHFYESWEAWIKMFPYYGEIWLKQTKELQLRNHWGPTVDSYADRLPRLKESEYRERALQGYISLSRSSEGFDLRTQDFSNGPKRYFILGEKESSNRQEIQIEAVNKYTSQTSHQKSTIVISGAGHVVPNDKPEEYVTALQSVLEELK